VRAFNGVKLSKFDLLSVCDDTRAVMLALDRSKKNPSGASSSSLFCSAGSCAVADALLVRRFGPRLAERFLPYDPAISQIRNAWRQQAYYDKTADLVVWSAATTHFLEISALHPDFALGVVSSSFSLSFFFDPRSRAAQAFFTAPPGRSAFGLPRLTRLVLLLQSHLPGLEALLGGKAVANGAVAMQH